VSDLPSDHPEDAPLCVYEEGDVVALVEGNLVLGEPIAQVNILPIHAKRFPPVAELGRA
jgi:hypothetical protein